MYQSSVIRKTHYHDGILLCDWSSLCEQLMFQWNRLNRDELDEAGPDRHRVAELIQRKYGVSSRVIENYLSNLERMLPMS